MKTMKQGKMEFPQLRGSLDTVRYPALLEPKIDGELDFFIRDAMGARLINKHGTVRTDCAITTLLDNVFAPLNVTLVGELHVNKGHNGELYDFLSHKMDDDHLKYKVFDLIAMSDDKKIHITPNDDLMTRRECLLDFLAGEDYEIVETVDSHLVQSRDEVDALFQQYTSVGYEGIVIKQLDSKYNTGPCSWVKVKYKDTSDYKVAFIDPTKERIEVEVQSVFVRRCGVKASVEQKALLKVGDMVTVEHQGILAAGGLRHPVLKLKGGKDGKVYGHR